MTKTRSVIGVFLLSIEALATPLVAGQLANPQQAEGDVVRRIEMTATLDVPDELVPAVMPYMNCMHAKAGPIYSAGKLLDLKDQPEDCEPVRINALADGVTLLSGLGIGKDDSERHDCVSKFLDDFDAFNRPKSQEELEALFASQNKHN